MKLHLTVEIHSHIGSLIFYPHISPWDDEHQINVSIQRLDGDIDSKSPGISFVLSLKLQIGRIPFISNDVISHHGFLLR